MSTSTPVDGVRLELTPLRPVAPLTPLTPLRRRSDPPCDGRNDTPSPPEREYDEDFVNDEVFKTRRLEGDGSEDVGDVPPETARDVTQENVNYVTEETTETNNVLAVKNCDDCVKHEDTRDDVRKSSHEDIDIRKSGDSVCEEDSVLDEDNVSDEYDNHCGSVKVIQSDFGVKNREDVRITLNNNDVNSVQNHVGDGGCESGDGDVLHQRIPKELTVLVKQVTDYAVLTGTHLPEPEVQEINHDDPGDVDTVPEEVKDENDNDPLLAEPVVHVTPIRAAPKRSPAKRVDIEDYPGIHTFKLSDLAGHYDQDDYQELFHRLSLMDEQEYGRRRTSYRRTSGDGPPGHARDFVRGHSSEPYRGGYHDYPRHPELPRGYSADYRSLPDHHRSHSDHHWDYRDHPPPRPVHGTRPKHSFGPQAFKKAAQEQKSRISKEKERFWKMTSFRQGKRHIKYFWDPATLSPGLEHLDYGTRILRSSHTTSTDGARGCMGFSNGKHVFVFKFNNLPWGTHCAVGVVRKDADLHLPSYGHLIGKDSLGWGWDIPSKQLIHKGPTGCTYPSANFQVPKEIQMTLDVDKGEIIYRVNGADLGVAFTGLKDNVGPTEEFFPACSCVFAMTEVNISMADSSHLVTKSLMTAQVSQLNNLQHHVNNNTETDPKIGHKDSESLPSLDDIDDNTTDETNDSPPLENSPIRLASICTLSPDLRYLVEVAHGWQVDGSNDMFFAHIPNNPTIIVPKTFPFDCVAQEQLIGIRSRLGVNSGCHSWQLKEELLLEPTGPEVDTCKHNDMIIGVGTEEFCQLFDGRRQPVEFLQHVTTFWGWRYTSKTLHNFYAKDKYYAENVPIHIEHGVTLVLNQDAGTLSFEHQHEHLGPAFTDLPKVRLFPILLHVSGTHPTSLLYIDGPPEYLKSVISNLEATSFTRSEYQSFLGYVVLRHSPWMSEEAVATHRMKLNFSWDRDSMAGTVFSLERKSPCRAICTPPPEPDPDRMDIIRGQMPISEGTHVWTYTFSNNIGHDDHYLLGVVNELFYTTDYTVKANPLCYLWLWDLKDKSLYHGTEHVAKYPVYPSSFDVRRYYRFQVAVTMSQKASLGFSSMAPHIPLDLGLAFSHLPPGKYYPCLVYRAGKLDCKLEYVKGPSGYIETHDKCCCPLQ